MAIKYPIEGTDLTIEVATTRPETMLGDSGIAVNPDDARYTHLVGKEARHPFTNRLVPTPMPMRTHETDKIPVSSRLWPILMLIPSMVPAP